MNTWLVMTLFILIPFGHIYGNSAQLNDIKGHWAEGNLQEWLDKGIVAGYPDGTFRPDQVISRGEFVALVNRAFHYSDKGSISFKDIEPTDWVYIEVQKAIAHGYIDGFNDNTFRPNEQITRQETAVILSKILNLKDAAMETSTSFEDSNLIPSWSISAINNMANKGIMTTYPDGMFQPQRQMTRAESVATIQRTLAASKVVYEKAGVYGELTKSTLQTNVVIQSANITLQNMHILGDLILAEGIGDGDAYLDRVQVDGVTRIEGGGMNSIHIQNSQIGKLIINRQESAVRVVAEGETVIRETQVLSSAIIEESNLSGEGFVDVAVLPETDKKRDITLAGDFNKFSLNANVDELKIRSGKIKNLYIEKELKIRSIILEKNVIVQKLDLRSKTTITGEGQIQESLLSDDAKVH
ncbi:S-layer homology domain-containing protein [Paenibacillus sp. N3.4]|uniref:S-layer homology domain-containing protein n=1 Tax=Paenibacillus sp. N3.4 TaxID=2603222 RepID=UPI001C9C0F0D|nr:S-layer homology domain-containing protein [Paenibacillus sp. N3.4]